MFRLLKEATSAQPTCVLPAGSYIVHVAFGLASTAKPVQVSREMTRETFEIAGGGLRIEGRVGNVKIPIGQISFDIYQGSQFEQSDRRPIASSVQTGAVVLVPEGTYYILSKYGEGNAVVRSDIRVAAGQLPDITVTHRPAQIMSKLVTKRAGAPRVLFGIGDGALVLLDPFLEAVELSEHLLAVRSDLAALRRVVAIDEVGRPAVDAALHGVAVRLVAVQLPAQVGPAPL